MRLGKSTKVVLATRLLVTFAILHEPNRDRSVGTSVWIGRDSFENEMMETSGRHADALVVAVRE